MKLPPDCKRTAGSRQNRCPPDEIPPMPHTPPLRTLRTLSVSILAAAAAFGCAYPRTIHVYDQECQITARHMVLDTTEVNAGRGCVVLERCAGQVVAEAAVLAASTVISGSIVVAGNIVYWLEKKRDCQPKAPMSGTDRQAQEEG